MGERKKRRTARPPGSPTRTVGPPEQRFGAFARRYAAQGVARLKLDDAFLRSLINGAIVRVTYLDDRRTTASSVVAVTKHGPVAGPVALGTLPFKRTERWLTADLPWSDEVLRAAGADHQLEIQAGDAPLTLHMVEVVRR